MKVDLFPICIFLQSPPASAQPKVKAFSRQWLKTRRICLFNSLRVNDFIWEQSMMQGKDLTAAALAATDSFFNLILFFISSSLSVYWPREYKGGIEWETQGSFSLRQCNFPPLEVKHKANCSPEFLKLSSIYETTFIILIPTFFSPNKLVLQVLQTFLPKIHWDSSNFSTFLLIFLRQQNTWNQFLT